MPRRFLCAILALIALPGPAAAEEQAAFLPGDLFVYERLRLDGAGTEQARSTVTWEVLASDGGGHAIRITEDGAGGSSASDWIFDRDNNVLHQQLEGCRVVNEPHSGRYAWPMSQGSTWSLDYRIVERCDATPGQERLVATCNVEARAVSTGTWALRGFENPAIEIGRTVACSDPARPGAVLIRWEKELLCPELAVRCLLEYDWVLLPAPRATETVVRAYRELPELQSYDGQVRETLVDVQLQ